MTVYRHTFEGWSNEETLTTGGTGSGDVLSQVITTGGGTATATTTSPVHGTKQGSFYAPSAGVSRAGWTGFSSAAIACSGYITVPVAPSVECRVLNLYRDDGSSSAPRLALTDGQLYVKNAAGATVANSAASIAGIGPVEFRFYCAKGTGTADGKMRVLAIRQDTMATIIDTGLLTNINTATLNYITVAVGRPSAHDWAGTILIDDLALDTAATDIILAYQDLGASAGPDQLSVEPWTGNNRTVVTLQGTGTDSWSQTSGPTVTLGGSGNTRTFNAPALLAGATMVFAYGTDSMTVTVLPATDAIFSGGILVPIRLRSKASMGI